MTVRILLMKDGDVVILTGTDQKDRIVLTDLTHLKEEGMETQATDHVVATGVAATATTAVATEVTEVIMETAATMATEAITAIVPTEETVPIMEMATVPTEEVVRTL